MIKNDHLFFASDVGSDMISEKCPHRLILDDDTSLLQKNQQVTQNSLFQLPPEKISPQKGKIT